MINANNSSFQVHPEMPHPFLEVAGWISSNMNQRVEMIRSMARVALGFHHFGRTERGMDLLVDSVIILDSLQPEEKVAPNTFAFLAGVLYKLKDYQDSDALVDKLSDPLVVELIASSSSHRLAIAQMRFLREEFDEGWIMLRSIEFEELGQEEIDECFRNLITYSNIPETQWEKFILDSRFENFVLLHFLPILASYPQHPAYIFYQAHRSRFFKKCEQMCVSSQSIEEELRYLMVMSLMSNEVHRAEEIIRRARELGQNADPISKIWIGKLELIMGNSDLAKLEFETVFKILHQRGISISDEEVLEELVRCLLQSGVKDKALDMISSLISPDRRARLLIEFESNDSCDEVLLAPLQALVFNHSKILTALTEAIKIKEKMDFINDILKTIIWILAISCIGASFWFLGSQ